MTSKHISQKKMPNKMKTLPILKAIVICLLFSKTTMLQSQSNRLSFVPKIQYDTATLSGKIIGKIPDDQGFKSISLALYKVVTGDRTDYNISVKKDGTFTFSVPIGCISFSPISSDYYSGLICLIPGEVTRLEISYDEDQKKQIKLTNSIGFTSEDAMIIDAWPLEAPDIGNEMISPEIFSQRVINGLPRILKPIENNTRLSDPAKQMLITNVKLLCIFYKLFEYNDYIKNAYTNQHKTDPLQKEFHPQLPDKSYYSFLKYFNLNDPLYLTSGLYPMVLQSLLNNKTLAIPTIGDIPIDKWLIKVKEILKNYIGSDTGLFYDLLVSNAYSIQLNEMNPLSDTQKKNIKFYFKNKSFVDILIGENENVIQIAAKNSKSGIQKKVKSSDNVMDSIISKYKGKAVFVDFWATWCGPCLIAMKESESVRKDFENKNVVFVYITNPSSPRKTWEQKISEIQGEQYYLTEKEWSSLTNIYDFTGIPHYLIFDKNGKLKHNHQAFMGVENMKKWLMESL
jgi:thiol-disulfide isomerase/thioredoxin